MTAPSGSPPAATGPALTPPPGPLERRARRLLRWYPAGWRARYGEEFAELLLAELSEQPRAWRRTADVARCGITARLAGAGLAGPPAGMAGARASLGTLACSLAVFLTFGTAMWAQLAVGWQWAPPDSTATSVAMLVMSGSLLVLAVLALLAVVAAGWAAIVAGSPGQARSLRAPALLIGAGALVLVTGGRHFGNGWPRYRRPLVAAPGSRARRNRRVRLGVHAVGHVVLGPPGRPGLLPARRARLDGAQPGRGTLPGHWGRAADAAAGAVTPGPGVRDPDRPGGRGRYDRLPGRGAVLGGPGRAGAARAVLDRRHRRGRAGRDGGRAGHRLAGHLPGQHHPTRAHPGRLVSEGSPTRAGRAGTRRTGTDRAGTNQAGADHAGADHAEADHAEADHAEADHAEADGAAASADGERLGHGRSGRLTRRRVLGAGLGGLAAVTAAGAGVIELAAHGVLPGRQLVDRLDGACSVASPPLVFSASGPSAAGTFYSRARRREVGYVIAWPPGHRPGAPLPLIVVLHPFGADHLRALTGMSPPQALAIRVDGRPLPPMAMAAADGGPGYWNPHPGDDPMAMVTDELIPLCQRHGLGRRAIGTFGISMGGYGALLLAEKHPRLISAVAAIGPAIWTSYRQARAVNPGAYASAAAFADADAVTHARALAGVAVRVACGASDPFYPGVQALTRALPPGAVTDLSPGCHSYPFFIAQEPPSLAFLGRHLSG